MEIMLRAVGILGLFAVAIFLLILIWAMITIPFKEKRKQQTIQEIDQMFREILAENKKDEK